MLPRYNFCNLGVFWKPSSFLNRFLFKFSSLKEIRPWRSVCPMHLIWLPAKLSTFSSLKLDKPHTRPILFPCKSNTSNFNRFVSPSIRFILQNINRVTSNMKICAKHYLVFKPYLFFPIKSTLKLNSLSSDVILSIWLS